MRRTGYNSLSNSEENEDGQRIKDDIVDGQFEDVEEAKPFTEIRLTEGNAYKRTLCLVFTLFFGGLVCSLSAGCRRLHS